MTERVMSELYTSLDGIRLGEGDDDLCWIHAMPAKASVKHPVHGTIEFTPERIRRFADSVNNRTRGIDLDIDYEHKKGAWGGRAAGWVQKAEVRSDGLWLGTELTPPAREAIKNREYRYFSPEFDDLWEDNSGNKHQDVLFGGALTNRPHLKSLQPYKLEEGIFYAPEPSTEPAKEGSRLSKWMESFQRFLGLEEDATEADVQKALSEKFPHLSQTPSQDPAPAPQPVQQPQPNAQPAQQPTQMSDVNPKLIERDKHVIALEEQVKKQARELAETKVDRYLTSLTQDGEFALSEPTKQAARRALLSADPDTAVAVQELLSLITKTGLVEMFEYGSARTDGTLATSDPIGSVERRAKNLQELAGGEEKLDYREAVRKVFQEDPGLWTQYNEAVMGRGRR